MIKEFEKGINEYNRPFLLTNNTKTQQSKETRKSTPNELKGVDTMKKNCYHRKDGRWQYSKQENGVLYYTIANTYRELLEKIKQIKPRQIKQIKNVKTKTLTFFSYYVKFRHLFISFSKKVYSHLI